MYRHKAVAGFEKRSPAAGKSSWLMSIALGALIAAAGCTLVFSGAAWFMPQVFTHYLFSMAVLATYGFYLFDSHQQDAALSPQATNDHP